MPNLQLLGNRVKLISSRPAYETVRRGREGGKGEKKRGEEKNEGRGEIFSPDIILGTLIV